MSWTAPATATAGSILTAAWLNTYVRDNFLAVLGGLVGTGFVELDLLGTGSAPSVSAASHATLYYDAALGALFASLNAGAYLRIGSAFADPAWLCGLDDNSGEF